MRGREPDADVLAELTSRSPMRKQPAIDPVLGLTRSVPARPVPVPVPEPEPVAEPVERKEKIGGWNGYPSNLARIRAAQFYTQTHPDGWSSLSEMTEQTLLAEAARLEQEHNGGEPFPPMPPGKIKHSRRSGS